MPSDRNQAIQWLRALAAIEVMIWHSDLVAKGFSDASIQASSYRALGGIGVEIFFVVSGFLMSAITLHARNAGEFVEGRMRRILPLYWAFTLLVIAIYLLNPGWHLGGFALDAPTVIKSFLIWPQAGYPIYPVGWTLEHEAVFYGIVALFTAMAMSRRDNGRIAFALLLAFFGLVGAFLPDWARQSAWATHVFSPYMFAFAIGWFLQIAPTARAGTAWGATAVVAVLFALASAAAEGHDAVLLPRVLLAGGVVAAALAAREYLGAAGAVHRTVALVGEASYSIYLCHWLVLSMLGKIVGTLGFEASADVPVRVAGCLVAVLVGTLFFRFGERPLDTRLRLWLKRSPPPAFAPASSSAIP